MDGNDGTQTHEAAGYAGIWRKLNGLLVAQAFGQFNDQALKQVVTILAMAAVVEEAAQVDDGPLADTVGQHTGWKREQGQRKHERDLGERRHPDLGSFLNHRGHRQDRHDLLERLVVELAEGLGDEKAVQLSPDSQVSLRFGWLARFDAHFRLDRKSVV